MSTRRELLKLGTMAGMAMLVPGVARAARSRPTSVRGAETLVPTREQLLAQLNTHFFVQAVDQPPVTLVLVRVADPAFSTARGRECFRALFRGPKGVALRQDTYAAANSALGEFPLFLVPMGGGPRGVLYYEAAFNRTVPE